MTQQPTTRFFNSNRSKYMWGNRVDAVVYECLNMDIANEVTKMLKNDTINSKHVLDKINKDSELNTRHRNGKFDVSKTKFFDNTDLKVGINPIYENDGKFFVVRVNEVLEPSQKEFNEAKGAVTSDYQSYLETEWLKQLEKKHKVIINTEALYSLGK